MTSTDNQQEPNFFFFRPYLDFEIEEAAALIGSFRRLQVELRASARLGQLGRLQHVVVIHSNKALLEYTNHPA